MSAVTRVKPRRPHGRSTCGRYSVSRGLAETRLHLVDVCSDFVARAKDANRIVVQVQQLVQRLLLRASADAKPSETQAQLQEVAAVGIHLLIDTNDRLELRNGRVSLPQRDP